MMRRLIVVRAGFCRLVTVVGAIVVGASFSWLVTVVGAVLIVVGASFSWLSSASAQDAGRIAEAARHHALGVEHHLRRALDDASREYARALDLDPPREPTAAEIAAVRRFAPRVYTTPTEFFPLADFAAVLHPERRLVAYHFFWKDDIDFPEDNDPCDHELMWVQYSPDRSALERIWMYFHGRILMGSEAALAEARQHAMRPRVNVQWGKHGSMPAHWEELPITANDGDIERKYLPLDQPITLGLQRGDVQEALNGGPAPHRPSAREEARLASTFRGRVDRFRELLAAGGDAVVPGSDADGPRVALEQRHDRPALPALQLPPEDGMA